MRIRWILFTTVKQSSVSDKMRIFHTISISSSIYEFFSVLIDIFASNQQLTFCQPCTCESGWPSQAGGAWWCTLMPICGSYVLWKIHNLQLDGSRHTRRCQRESGDIKTRRGKQLDGRCVDESNLSWQLSATCLDQWLSSLSSVAVSDNIATHYHSSWHCRRHVASVCWLQFNWQVCLWSYLLRRKSIRLSSEQICKYVISSIIHIRHLPIPIKIYEIKFCTPLRKR